MTLWDLFARVVVVVIAFPLHELGHAWMAYVLGDDLPRRQGRLTWDPRAHVDPWGALLLLLSGFGWARPVAFRPEVVRRRHPYGPLAVLLAGPAANLLLGILSAGFAALALHIQAGLAVFLQRVALLNFVLVFFNLLPLPPLDGYQVVRELWPSFWWRYLAPLERYALLVFLLMLWGLPRLGLPVLTWLVYAPAWHLTQALLHWFGL